VTVLVLGAGGFIGLNVTERLLARRIDLRCGRRARGNVLTLRRMGAPLVVADLDEPATVEEAMRGCDVVVHCAGHYPRHSLDREGTLAVGARQIRTVLDAAARARVRRLVYVSSTATVAPAPDGRSDERHRFEGPPGFGVYHDLKWAMESAVLAEDRFEVVVVCPGACLGPWDLRVGTSALVLAIARGLGPPYPDGVVNVVDARDVAEAVSRLVVAGAPPRSVLI
jgi:dihydroflavonol-4-reductase